MPISYSVKTWKKYQYRGSLAHAQGKEALLLLFLPRYMPCSPPDSNPKRATILERSPVQDGIAVILYHSVCHLLRIGHVLLESA